MKTFVYLTSVVALLFVGCAEKSSTTSMISEKTPQTDTEKAAYSIGFNVGNGIKSQGMQRLDVEFIALGLYEAMNDKEERFTVEEMQGFIQNYQAIAKKEVLGKNKDFLVENAKKEGINITESGLQYEVIVEGSGSRPKAEDEVTVHYTGTLIDGTKFDSSVDRGEPTSFPLNRVIPGWTEGLQLMSVGSKYRFYIPSELGYGERGAAGVIGPGATLIFDIELLEIK